MLEKLFRPSGIVVPLIDNSLLSGKMSFPWGREIGVIGFGVGGGTVVADGLR